MLFQSFVMHYNTPRFYMELKHSTIPRFTQVVGYSFGIASTISIVIAASGFLTFGEHSSSFILNNYSPHDQLAFISRIGIFISTTLIYPLAFVGVRDGLFDVFQVPPYLRTDRTYVTQFTIFLLSILTIGAIVFHDLGLINAVGGGALATFLCFVFPALMYRRAVLMTGTPASSSQPSKVRESWFGLALMAVGVVLGTMGVYQSILEAR
jgi:amino acid permease